MVNSCCLDNDCQITSRPDRQLVTYDLDNALTQVVTGPDVIAEDVTATDGLIIFSIADKGIRSVTFTR